MSFREVVLFVSAQPEFVREWERLSGKSLSTAHTALDRMIDSATGNHGLDEEAVKEFIEFVYETVWCRAPAAL